MRSLRRHIVAATAGLLLTVGAAACDRFGPDLSIEIDNTAGATGVTVTVDSSGSRRAGETVRIGGGTGAAWSVPLGATWEVKLEGKHLIGSGDRPDLALPSSGQQRDVRVLITVADTTVQRVEACFDDDYVAGRCT